MDPRTPCFELPEIKVVKRFDNSQLLVIIHNGNNNGALTGSDGKHDQEVIGVSTTFVRAEEETGSDASLRQAYESSYLKQNQRFVGILGIAAGLLQLAFLMVDLGHVPRDAGQNPVLFMRIATGVSAFTAAWFCIREAIGSFRLLSRVVSLLECAAIATFLVVFNQYDPPHYLIQTLGLIFLVMIIFFVPNRWNVTLGLAVAAVVAFSLSAWLKLRGTLPANEYWAGVFYMAASVGLCGAVSYMLDLRSMNEFAAKQELIRLNTIDPLTLACNRTKLVADFDRWSVYSKRHHQPLSLALFDVDQFKKINDELGHLKADQVLRDLVALIKEHLRNTDIIARWGGDEFVILFPGIDPEGAEQALARIRQALGASPLAGTIAVTCSYGITGLEKDGDLDTLIRKADALMYRAKRFGGDRICRSPLKAVEQEA